MPKTKAGKSVSPPRSGRPSSKSPPGPKSKSKSNTAGHGGAGGNGSVNANGGPALDGLPRPIGYLITCDVPTKQYIQALNAKKEPSDKRFIIKNLDATHLLVKEKAKDDILWQVEQWENSNVYSAIEKVGEDFDMS